MAEPASFFTFDRRALDVVLFIFYAIFNTTVTPPVSMVLPIGARTVSFFRGAANIATSFR